MRNKPLKCYSSQSLAQANEEGTDKTQERQALVTASDAWVVQDLEGVNHKRVTGVVTHNGLVQSETH